MNYVSLKFVLKSLTGLKWNESRVKIKQNVVFLHWYRAYFTKHCQSNRQFSARLVINARYKNWVGNGLFDDDLEILIFYKLMAVFSWL